MVITQVRNASPDMILTAFDVKFHEKQDELPPEVCRPFKKPEKNYVEQVDPKKVEKKQCRTSGPPKSRKKTMSKKWVQIYSYIPSYTSIYLHIPPNSFIYLHIPPQTSKY